MQQQQTNPLCGRAWICEGDWKFVLDFLQDLHAMLKQVSGY